MRHHLLPPGQSLKNSNSTPEDQVASVLQSIFSHPTQLLDQVPIPIILLGR
jgi:hypothetical protein